jgi:hypothetical protein
MAIASKGEAIVSAEELMMEMSFVGLSASSAIGIDCVPVDGCWMTRNEDRHGDRRAGFQEQWSDGDLLLILFGLHPKSALDTSRYRH